MTADINPKVSIIIATLNSADHIRECLDSVLDQTVEGIEVPVLIKNLLSKWLKALKILGL